MSLPRFNVVSSDLRIRRVSLITWAISVLLLVTLIIGVYPAIKDQSSLNSIYGDLSPTLQALLGGSSLTSPSGYLDTQLFAFFLPAVLLVYAISRGSAAVAGEEEERTLDLLLAQPVSRQALYVEKAGAVTVGILALSVAVLLPIVALGHVLDLDIPRGDVVAVCIQMALFCLALALAADALAAATGRRVIGTAITVGYTAVSYVIFGVSATVTWLRPVRPLTLWRWYVGADPLDNGFDGIGVLVLALTCVVALVAGAIMFDRRDLHG